jgi:hypothetical protein
MATASTSTVSTPRLDRKFVDESGNLTQTAYALLSNLVRRTGGVVGEVIDVAGLQEQITDQAETNVAQDEALEKQAAALQAIADEGEGGVMPSRPEQWQHKDDPAPEMEEMRARLHQLETLVNDLLIGYSA